MLVFWNDAFLNINNIQIQLLSLMHAFIIKLNLPLSIVSVNSNLDFLFALLGLCSMKRINECYKLLQMFKNYSVFSRETLKLIDDKIVTDSSRLLLVINQR